MKTTDILHKLSNEYLNLDAMEESELAEIQVKLKELSETAKTLAAYCEGKKYAMQSRKSGKIDYALHFEESCDAVYERLPEWARW